MQFPIDLSEKEAGHIVRWTQRTKEYVQNECLWIVRLKVNQFHPLHCVCVFHKVHTLVS